MHGQGGFGRRIHNAIIQSHLVNGAEGRRDPSLDQQVLAVTGHRWRMLNLADDRANGQRTGAIRRAGRRRREVSLLPRPHAYELGNELWQHQEVRIIGRRVQAMNGEDVGALDQQISIREEIDIFRDAGFQCRARCCGD